MIVAKEAEKRAGENLGRSCAITQKSTMDALKYSRLTPPWPDPCWHVEDVTLHRNVWVIW